jgi:hypothetical protein
MRAVVTVIFEVCNSVRMSYLFVGPELFKSSTYPISTPNPVYQHLSRDSIYIYAKRNARKKISRQEWKTLLCSGHFFLDLYGFPDNMTKRKVNASEPLHFVTYCFKAVHC